MIQSYDQIKKQANLINEEVEENVYIQKIYSSSYFLCLTIRFIGRTKFIYIGRGASYEGLWFSENRVESFLRKRDKFLEYLRKHLSSTSLKSITNDEDDRIFSLDYYKWGRINKMFFFYNARNLYFANHFYDEKSGMMKCFCSWTLKAKETEVVGFDIFDEVGRKSLERKSGVSDVKNINSLLAFEKKAAMKGNVEGKSKKFYNRKKSRILQDLENVNSIPALRILAENEKDFSKLPMKIDVEKIKLKFKSNEHFKRRDEVYSKIKKLNKAKKILDLRLSDTLEKLVNYSDTNLINNLKTIAPVWKRDIKKLEIKQPLERGFKLIEFESFTMGIGLNSNGNDQLRSEWAKKSDYWFHLDGDKSAHIIIKLREMILTQEVLSIVASALIDFSQFEYTEANLIYTQVKNLKGVKGSSGKVIYKKEKRIRVQTVPDWRPVFD